jgi:hypothetical protein
MTQKIDIIINKYVIPYRQYVEKRKDILSQLKSDNDCLEIIQLLLNHEGWRERAFGATASGVLRIDQFVDLIYKNAISFDEYHAAEKYAFVFIVLNNNKTNEYLIELSSKIITNSYSKNIQHIYRAGLAIKTNDNFDNQEILQAKRRLLREIDFWKEFK